ncbi:MAG: hypothetical protein IPP88_02630 [Betaproteobacteria bacterium]|nr:hypothetical protein [Betaproteobacteria bacterium]
MYYNPSIPAPTRRPLKIFAVDPMLGKTFGNRAKVDIVNEPLQPGPIGHRIAVIDYDGTRKTFYEPVNLDDAAILMQGGLDPSESDPRFHQQMVYAVAMKTIENFARALGRLVKLGTSKNPVLRIFPHAFYGANAYYSRNLNAVLFGYFRADESDPGENLPGQVVYTCLSHDVIAHEVTHKVVDRLRPLFLEPSNHDVLAFHEGFSDIVALFQHFSFPEVLREQIAKTRSDIRSPTTLVELARQFGYATGSGKSLRSALDQPAARLYETVVEPHDRGSILVAAVFDGFYKTYQRRIYDLIRIATGGSGVLPSGDLHPDLVNRIAIEASKTAQRVLDMCIRAFDYLPPVDITFGDFLRGLVTADYELNPEDDLGLRGAMIEAFRLRGIYASGVVSLAEESLLWDTPRGRIPDLPQDIMDLLPELFFSAVLDFDLDSRRAGAESESSSLSGRYGDRYQKTSSSMLDSDDDGQIEVNVGEEMAKRLNRYATENAAALGLENSRKIEVHGFHPVFRVAPNGRLVIELIAQFAQADRSLKNELGGLPFRGGATLVINTDGAVRYVVRKPMASDVVPDEFRKQGQQRLAQQRAFVSSHDARDPGISYMTTEEHSQRMLRLANLARLHEE